MMLTARTDRLGQGKLREQGPLFPRPLSSDDGDVRDDDGDANHDDGDGHPAEGAGNQHKKIPSRPPLPLSPNHSSQPRPHASPSSANSRYNVTPFFSREKRLPRHKRIPEPKLGLHRATLPLSPQRGVCPTVDERLRRQRNSIFWRETRHLAECIVYQVPRARYTTDSTEAHSP